MATLRSAFRRSETKTASLLSSNLNRAVSLVDEAGLVETEWVEVLRERNVTSLFKVQVLLYLVEKKEDGYERVLTVLQRHQASGKISGFDKILDAILSHTANPSSSREEWKVSDTTSRGSSTPGRALIGTVNFHSCNIMSFVHHFTCLFTPYFCTCSPSMYMQMHYPFSIRQCS